VRVTPHEDAGDRRRVAARLKTSAALDAAIRAEARKAAREEVRARFRSSEARQGAATRFAVKAGFGGGGRHEGWRRPLPAADAAALLRILEKAFEHGGPARARAVLELCLGHESQGEHGLLVGLQERETNAERARHRGSSREQAPRGRPLGEGFEQGRPGDAHARPSSGAATPVVQAPARAGAPVVQAPAEAGGPEAPAPAGAGAPVALTPAAPTTPSRVVGSGVDTSNGGTVEGAEESGTPMPPSQPPNSTEESPGTAGASPPVVQEVGAASRQRELPFTGSEVPLFVLAGCAALAMGALLRRNPRRGVR
jgi:hypothetical protein